MAKVFGIISSTLPTGITGQVIGDASITGDIGDTKDLVGNPSSTIADSRTGTPNIRKMTVNFAFATGEFDCVVMSQTLQTIPDVEHAILEITRVGKLCIVSIPNFAYHRLRKMLVEEGRAPKSGVLHNEWYNSPNIRFFTIL